MKHLKRERKFGRMRDQRKALLKSLLSALFLKERIKTTEAKAKEASRLAEKFITKAKRGDLVYRRLLAKFLSPIVIKKLFSEIAPKYKERKGGYTRIIKFGPRKTDGAKMAIIELVK
jgi:large subunit ribosomal protein L17